MEKKSVYSIMVIPATGGNPPYIKFMRDENKTGNRASERRYKNFTSASAYRLFRLLRSLEEAQTWKSQIWMMTANGAWVHYIRRTLTPPKTVVW